MKTRHVLGGLDRLKKLRAMSKAELLHRLKYKGIIAVERWQHARGSLARPDRLRRSVGAAGSDREWGGRLVAGRRQHADFFPSVAEPEAIRALFRSRFADEADRGRRAAADAMAHRFSFFGRVFEYGRDIPWQADPVTGAQWPPLYHADVPVHGGDTGFGDVKHVWELSRQQYLVDLAKAWFLDGDAKALDAMRSLVRSWVAGNPYATGVNWACALEPAFRVFSWLWAYHLTRDGLDDEFHLEWLEALHDHGRFLERHLEHYSSPYNHLMAEAAALYMLGCCLTEAAEARRWREAGRAVLAGRLAEQFYGDGGSVEQSTFYHHATVGFLLLAALVSSSRGERLPASVWTAIERGLEFSMALAQPDGLTPSIGGADDGKPIRMEHLPFWDFRPYLAIGAVVFDRVDFKAAAGRFYEDALWLTGTAGLKAFDRLPLESPVRTSESLPASGYYVLRGSSELGADYICMDIGEQAAGMRTDAIPNSMHGHADCLSIVLWLAGVRTLVDSGFYSYNAGGAWEAHFRETAAHSTARVDSRDQARHIGKMAWSHSYRASLKGWSPDGGLAWAVGSHDGYSRGPNGVVHRRTVCLRPGHIALVLDEFEGTGQHDLEVNFQFAPGRLEMCADGAALFDGRIDLAWAGDGAWTAVRAEGGPGPADGWIASSLGVRAAAPRVTLRRRVDVSRNHLLTAFSLRSGAEPRVHHLALAGVEAATLTGADGADLLAEIRDLARSRGTAR